jgi:phosphoglycerol transferase MdoB-like AlkP superfamily enzyme
MQPYDFSVSVLSGTVALPQTPPRLLPEFLRRQWASPYGVVAVAGAIFFLISNITRCVLLWQSAAEVDFSAWVLIKTFMAGFFYDAVTCAYVMAPLTAILAFAPQQLFAERRLKWLFYGFIFVLFAILVFTACAEYFFWEEFEARFDFVAVDYLVYQREVKDNIRQSYPLKIIFPSIGMTALLLFAAVKRPIDRCLKQSAPWRQRALAGCVFLMVPLCSAIFISDSLSRISANRLNNNLAMNGIYSFFEALRNNRIEYAQQYATMDTEEVSRRLRLEVDPQNRSFIDPSGAAPDIWRTIKSSSEPETRHNVVVVVLESMSAEFLRSLGGRGNLTPNLDALARQGLLFTNLYANGTRTIRGLEAIALSVPPTPPVSVLRRVNNDGLFTIATPFLRRGYDASFFYGGHSYFDNMAAFFSGNGFAIIDRGELSRDEITFSSAWGVCDEDLYRRVVREADAVQGRGGNFFMMVMTTSNHKPFTYPKGKIDIPSGKGRPGGVKYADLAIGELIKNASTKPWFDNTIFVFVADHCARSGGRNEIPVDNYQIPCIFYAPKIVPPGTANGLASQIDIAPTLFDLLNWQYTSSFVGRSIFKTKPEEGRAFISNHMTLGYLKGDILVALEPGGKVNTYKVDPATHVEELVASCKPVIEEAITYYQGVSSMLNNKLKR